MDSTETLATPGQQAQQLQHAEPTGTGGQPHDTESHGQSSNDWSAPEESQPNHFALPDHVAEHDDLPETASDNVDLSGLNLDHAASPNAQHQNGTVNEMLEPPHEAQLPGHGQHLHPQVRWVTYQILGNQGYPFMLESELRNCHANEFIISLNRERSEYMSRSHYHAMRRLLQQEPPSVVRASDLNGDYLDSQGIAWASMGISRDEARHRRRETFVNYTNIKGADKLKGPDDKVLSPHRNFFRFRKTYSLSDTRLAHFQLRNLLACPSRTQAFYPTIGGLRCINPLTGFIKPALGLTPKASFSCVVADYGVVMGGAMNGSYSIRRLDGTVSDAVEGSITRAVGGGANHMDMYTSRGSNSPHVGICSNDSYFRVMDLRTQRMLSSWKSDGPFNCSSVSKDGRTRVMMGDLRPVVICDATSGSRIQTLAGHHDYGFACAWSDDGRTLATGNQDRKVCIWDARKWCDSNGHSCPVATIWSEMAGVRSLKFSPAGSGQPVLVAAEDADFINIIDAQTYDSKQTIDIFGNIGGIAFTNEGRDLNVFCCDPARGSLMQFERCGREVEPLLQNMHEEGDGYDLSAAQDPRTVAYQETPYRDLMGDYIDPF